MGQIVTPDFWAGLLIGSFAVYACWLLSLSLAEPEDWEMGCGCKIAGLNGPYPHPNTWQGVKDAHPDYAMGDPPTGGFYGVARDPIGDALVLLDKAFSDE